jgi:malate dehydrogenase
LISIIGSGKVGSAIGFLVAATSLDDIVLVNRNKEKAQGTALDISNAVSVDSSVSVVGTDDYSKIKNSEVIIISASAGSLTTSRMDLLEQNVALIRDIAKKIKQYSPESKILIVTNPLDIVTYVFQKEASYQTEKVIGIAGNLDSSRFRYVLAKELNADIRKITNTIVLGEHGDTMVPIFSHARYNGKPVLDFLSTTQIQQITDNVRNYWRDLRKNKVFSIFGISKNTVDVARAIIKNENTSLSASVLLDGKYGLSDLCLGVPVRINKNGINKIEEIKLEKSELELLRYSASVVKNYLKSCAA